MSWITGLVSWAKEKIMSILPVQDVYDRMGVKPQVSVNMQSLIDEWRQAYQGSPSWITDPIRQKTLGFPSIVCWDIAKKAIGELEISASLPTPEGQEDATDDFTTKFISRNIKPFLRNQVEYSLAMGGIVARPWFDQEAGKVRIGWYTADNAIPTAWDGKKMTGVILVDRYIQSVSRVKKYFTKLESHKPIKNGWEITTKLFKSDSEASLGFEVGLSAVAQWSDITPVVTIIGDVCPFSYMGTPWANNQDLNSPQGTSIFRDAMDKLPELDKTYTNLSWETESGAAKVFVDDAMIETDENGNDKLDSLEKRLYRKMSSTSGNDLLEPYSPSLRVEQFNAALKTQLSVACMLCHLDAGAYVYDQASNAITATEVRTKQQQTYGTILDIQTNMIQPFVTDLLNTIRATQALYETDEIPDDILLGFDFGDSILVDEETDRAYAQTEVSAGLRSKLTYLMDWRGMTEQQALAEIERINAETPVKTEYFGA